MKRGLNPAKEVVTRFSGLLAGLLLAMPFPASEGLPRASLIPMPLAAPTRSTVARSVTNSLAVEFVGSIGGSVTTVAISDTFAYISEGGALTVLDVSNPSLPMRLSRLPLLESALGVQVVGKLAYVADYSGGLQIIDVSNSVSPMLSGSYNTPG